MCPTVVCMFMHSSISKVVLYILLVNFRILKICMGKRCWMASLGQENQFVFYHEAVHCTVYMYILEDI